MCQACDERDRERERADKAEARVKELEERLEGSGFDVRSCMCPKLTARNTELKADLDAALHFQEKAEKKYDELYALNLNTEAGYCEAMQRAEEAEARVRFLELAQEIMTADRDEWEHAHKDLKDRLLSPARARIAELERVLQTVTNLLQKALDVIAFEKRGKS
jgi:hypothetical protein